MNSRLNALETQFLNVDLDVVSTRSLDAFIEGLGGAVTVMHRARQGRRWIAHLELSASGLGQSADRLVRRFVAAIERLSPNAKAAWRAASRRIFDVGIQAGSRGPSLHLSLKPATVAAIAAVGAELVITVYPPTSRLGG